MRALGYVVIEYNQASHWPELHTPYMLETESEAWSVMETAQEHTKDVGRGETFAIARVELVGE